MRRLLAILVLLSACGGEGDVQITTALTAITTATAAFPTTTIAAATTSVISTTTTATTALAGAPDLPVIIPVGEDGVTYDLDGAPVTGPSSFAVAVDGSIFVSDTIAIRRLEPRLLHLTSAGMDVLDLRPYEVHSVVDLVVDGPEIVLLDVFIPMNRYRVVWLESGTAVELPPGFRFENGLTGLAVDDQGVLLEFEFGYRYARVYQDGTLEVDATRIVSGRRLGVEVGPGRGTTVTVGESAFVVERATELGGTELLGLAPDGTVLVQTSEVFADEDPWRVVQWVRRYTPDGVLVAEVEVDPADQAIEMARPLEMGLDGTVYRLLTFPDYVEIDALDV